MRFQPLEKLMNLYDGYARAFKIDNLSLLLRQEAGTVYLTDSHCPHRGTPLATATVIDGTIVCPSHGYCFSAVDGALLSSGQEACKPLRVYEIVYEGNELGLMVDDEAVTG